MHPSLNIPQYKKTSTLFLSIIYTTFISLTNPTLALMGVALCYVIVYAIALITILCGRIVYAVTCSDAETITTGFCTNRPRTPAAPRVIASVTYEKHELGILYFLIARLFRCVAKCKAPFKK